MNRSLRGAFALVFFTSFFSTLNAQHDGNVLPEANRFKEISNLFYLPDSAATLQVTDFQTNSTATGFLPLTNATEVNSSIKTYWLKFSIANKSSRDNKWVLDFPNWAYVDLYIINGVAMQHKRTGFRVPSRDRDYSRANNNYIVTALRKDEEANCMVRLQSYTDKQYTPTTFKVIAAEKEFLDEKNNRVSQVMSSFIGIFLVMLLYNLFVYISIKDKNYLYYLLILLLVIYLTLQNSGFVIQLFSFWDGYPAWRDTFDSVASTLLIILSVQFTRRFLNVRSNFPRWDKIFYGINIAACISFIALYINYDIGFALSNLVTLFMFVAILIVAIKSSVRRVPSSGYFLTGWIFLLAGSFILIFVAARLLPITDFNLMYALPLGTIIQMVLFSFALGNKINTLIRENDSKQERIISQLRENEELQTRVQRELEQKVEERTKEINAQKEEISTQKKAIEIERDKSDALLLNILPKEVAEELKSNGFARAKHYENVTVFFADIKDFTKISETLIADELVRQLDFYFQKFDEIVSKHGLEKIKTIGDAYMAVGGIADTNATDNSVNVVNCALEIMHFVKQMKDERDRAQLPFFEIRIGIHSGPVIAGVVGNKKFQFDLWGDTVNIAARMEQTSEPGKINISEVTLRLIEKKFNCTPRGKILAKNKGKIEMYFVEDGINVATVAG